MQQDSCFIPFCRLSAYKHAFPQLDTSNIRLEAKDMEQTAFDKASSAVCLHESILSYYVHTDGVVFQDHYDELCYNYLSQLQQAQKPTRPEPSSDEDSSYQKIGAFKAVYHRSGLFSTIFRAQDPKSSSLVALKLTYLSRMSPPHNSLREARLLSLATHQHVIPLLSTFRQSGDQHILVFPFINHTLEELLGSKALTPSQIASWLYDLFSALAHIHHLGIIHRDVKPSNILLASPSGPAYLSDFGIAWKDGDLDSEPADNKITDVGTTAYRPPELLFGHTSYDESLDLWAAGCVVAEALMGGKRTLFDAGSLGSELALIHSIFNTLGTPTSESWPVGKT
jgi:serine/threonine protein kinase